MNQVPISAGHARAGICPRAAEEEEVCRGPEVEEACPELEVAEACPGWEAQAFFGPDLADIWAGLGVAEAFPEPEAADTSSWAVRY